MGVCRLVVLTIAISIMVAVRVESANGNSSSSSSLSTLNNNNNNMAVPAQIRVKESDDSESVMVELDGVYVSGMANSASGRLVTITSSTTSGGGGGGGGAEMTNDGAAQRGCDVMSSPTSDQVDSDDMKSFVVLMDMSECSVEDKIRMAMESNANALLIKSDLDELDTNQIYHLSELFVLFFPILIPV